MKDSNQVSNGQKTLIYSTNTDSDDISVVDLERREEISRIAIGGSPRGSVKFDKKRNIGYISNCAGNTISVLDLENNSEIAKIEVGLSPRGLFLSDDGNYAFVSNSGSNTLSVVDLVKREQIKELPMGQNPRHMGLITQKNKLLVCQWGSDAVGILDLSGGIERAALSTAISVGTNARPYSLSINSDGSRAYVANTQADYMSVIDVDENRESARVIVGYGGRAIALSKDEKCAFISVENSNEIVIIDLTKNEVIHRLEVGPSPRGIALDAPSKLLFAGVFTRSKSIINIRNALSIIDISNPPQAKYVGNINVGLGPCSVSILNK